MVPPYFFLLAKEPLFYSRQRRYVIHRGASRDSISTFFLSSTKQLPNVSFDGNTLYHKQEFLVILPLFGHICKLGNYSKALQYGVRIATATKSEQNWKRKVFSRALICSKKACIGFASGSSTTQGRLYSLLLSSQETKVELLHFMGGC